MELLELPVEKIVPSPFQPRETFGKEELDELAASIKEHGLIQPITVRRTENGTYQIIAGERRWRATQRARLKKIMAVIKDVTPSEQAIQSLIENLHRMDLTFPEKGRGAMEVFRAHGVDMSLLDIARAVNNYAGCEARSAEITDDSMYKLSKSFNVSLRTLHNWLRAATATPEVLQLHATTATPVQDSVLTQVATIEDPELQKKVYTKIAEQEMGISEGRRFVTQIKKAAPEAQKTFLQPGLKVHVVADPESGYALEVPPEEVEKMKAAFLDAKKATEEALSKLIVIERGAHRRNWQAHLQVLAALDQMFCPFCGAENSKLRWSCHPDKTIDEAREQSGDNLTEAGKRTEPDARFKRVIEEAQKV